MLFAGTASASSPTPVPVNVHVKQSDSSPLAGADIHYKCGSSTLDFGTTDTSGNVTGNLPDGSSCTLTAIYRNSSSAQTVTITDPTNLEFQTSAVTVSLSDHSGGALAGGTVAFQPSTGGSTIYLNPVGSTTDGTGSVVGQLFDGTYNFRMQYNAGTEWRNNVSVGGATTVPFQTGLLSVVYSNQLAFGGPTGDSAFFTKSGTELLPGTYNFHARGVGYPVGSHAAGSGCQPITIDAPAAGTTATKSIVAAQIKDSQGAPLAGATASYYAGGWASLGTTDSTGSVCQAINGNWGNVYVAMTYQGTRQQIGPQNVTTNSVFSFQTTDVAVQLQDADGNPLDTGNVSYYAGGWHTVGDTSGGQVNVEMLPGSYSFAMTYNHTREQRNGVAISGPTTNVTFQTGRLTAHFSESFDWLNSEFYPFSQPTMEFLPGNINLDFQGCYVPLTITAGDHLVKSGILVKLSDSSGHPLAGGVASAYVHGWHLVGTTTASGKTCAAFDGTLGNTAVAVVYKGSRQQISQNEPTNSVYNFQTANVVVQLRNSSDALSDTGTASYYAGGWHPIGTTSGGTVSVQLLPGSYSFAMTFNGTREQFNGVAISGTSTDVVFQTTDAVVQLKDSAGDLITGPVAGIASYYASGWHAIGTTGNTGQVDVQMLPGSYSFAMTFNGTREQFNGVAISGTSTDVVFQTTDAVVQLKDSAGDLITGPAAGAASYYASGWHAIGTTGNTGQVDVQMLPGSYSFAMTFNGTREQFNHVAISGPSTDVIFQTTDVVVKLEDSAGAPLDTGTASYYAGGWHPIGTTTSGQVDVQMLPGSYSFAMTVNGTREQFNHVATSGTPVTFQTGEVDSATATNYYASGWKPFTSGVQLLPGSYTFRFSSGPNAIETIHAGQVNTIP